MGNNIGKLNSGIDLMQDAQRHYDFIKELNFYPQLFHRNVIKFAIIRYEKYWLPFVARHIGKNIVAPLDIELIWVSHMLNPIAYERDCFAIASRLIPHYMATSEERNYDKFTQKLWYSMYPEDISLEIDLSHIPPDLKPYHSNLTSNLINAVNDYRLFCHQVSLPHYRDEKFLLTAVHDYIRDAEDGDLRKTTYPYHKGFMWKTHMTNPSAYKRDVKALNERIVGRVQMKSTRGGTVRKKTWVDSNEFEETVDGAMYRGEITPLQELITSKELSNMGGKILGLRITSFRLEGLDTYRRYDFCINAKGLKTSEEEMLIRFDIASKGKIFMKTFHNASNQNCITFDSNMYDTLRFEVMETSQSHANPYPALDGRFSMEFRFPGEEEYHIGEEFKVTFRLPFVDGLQQQDEILGWIKIFCEETSVTPIQLHLAPDKNHLQADEHYCNVLKYPLSMAPYATKLDDAPCSYLNMILADTNQTCKFKSRILQSNLGDFSAIEIFDSKNALIASSYTVGRETIPSINQIGKPDQCCAFQSSDEIIFIIRSTNYDWGLLKILKSSDENILQPNKVFFMNLKAIAPKWDMLYDCNRSESVISYAKSKNRKLIIDLNNITLTLPPMHRDFSEFISLGVSIITLFCVKKMQTMN